MTAREKSRLAPRAADLLSRARSAAIESAGIIADRNPSRDDHERVGDPRCAARYAHLWGCSIEAAAREFGVGLGAVLRQWLALYPGEETALLEQKRGGR
jgi:hypothetical protein